MGNWDDLETELKGVDLGQEAGEWAVIAMACVAFADGSADDAELAKVREIVSAVSVIKDSLGPAFGEQLYLDTIERLKGSPDEELASLKQELRRLAEGITEQKHRDDAFQTLVAVSTADRKIEAAEYRIMQELKEIIGSQIMVPMPNVSV